MCDHWMPQIGLPLTVEQFHQLPRNAAYKYEYFGGQAWLNPRPRHFHGMLQLTALAEPSPVVAGEPVRIRGVREADFPSLEPVFAAAFQRMQPFGSLPDARRAEAAHQCLARTRTGRDGPWIEQASFLAFIEQAPAKAPEKGSNPLKSRGLTSLPEQPIGAILITLLPEGDPCDFDSYYWPGPPPPDCIERRLGRPHLTWIFVSPLHTQNGVATTLLAAAVHELRQLGFTELLSTFLLGNDSSMLWHWRAGFQLLPHPRSRRRKLNQNNAGNKDQKLPKKSGDRKPPTRRRKKD
jgi:hypothetical protein